MGLEVFKITVNNRYYNSIILMRLAIDCETQRTLYVANDQPQSAVALPLGKLSS